MISIAFLLLAASTGQSSEPAAAVPAEQAKPQPQAQDEGQQGGQQQAQQQAVRKTAAKPDRNDPNRMVCKREQQIGSLVRSKKICRTQAEWKELANQSKDYGNQQQQRAGEVRNPG